MKRKAESTAGVSKAPAYLDDLVCTSVSLLVLQWQSTGAETTFEAIIEQVRPHVERVAERVLRRHGLRDPAAVDDTVSLVLDHLRRLYDTAGEDRPVAKFAPAPPPGGGCTPRDPGRSFITCLATDRARDVARARRRQRSVPFSQLGGDAARAFERRITDHASAAAGPMPIDRVRAAAGRLEPQQRLLVELLLEGKSQTMIAHVLGVCEGTVSRLRRRAIMALRSLLEE